MSLFWEAFAAANRWLVIIAAIICAIALWGGIIALWFNVMDFIKDSVIKWANKHSKKEVK